MIPDQSNQSQYDLEPEKQCGETASEMESAKNNKYTSNMTFEQLSNIHLYLLYQLHHHFHNASDVKTTSNSCQIAGDDGIQTICQHCLSAYK